MPRRLRIEYPGATYHIMARGNRRELIFLDDRDRERFLKLLGDACAKTGWEVRAFVLMSNHYHWVLHTPEGNLVAGMTWFQNAYTRYFNTRHRLWGRLFGDRYKSVPVEDHRSIGGMRTGDNQYLCRLLNYVHLNPARAGLIDPGRGESVLDYPWSSIARGYAVAPSKRPDWMEVETGLELARCQDTVAGRRRYIEELDRRILLEGAEKAGKDEASIEDQAVHGPWKRGWYWGGQAFREWLLSKCGGIEEMSRSYRSGDLGKDHAKARAEKILEKGSRELGFESRESMRIRRRGDLRQVAIGWAIWRNTNGVTQRWIAEQLGMKSPANASQLIRRFEQMKMRELPNQLRRWKKEMSNFVA